MRKISGFVPVQSDALSEFRAEGTLWIHEKTGAPVYHVATDDPETLVAFVFPTPPSDSTGVAHILEHTVLCGSQKYPTKDPFLSLLKSSLNTFLNAMTYPDKTVYPLASVVPKDFMNLLQVYADAVYRPLLKPEAFRQEGHRLEWDDQGGLVRSGVVYNEMKGNYASSEGVIGDLVQRALFDTGPYSFDSGGDPDHIPELTYEQFVQFHQEHYHPSKGLVFLYGKLDPAPILKLLHKRYFRHYDRVDLPTPIQLQPRWTTPRTVRGKYPVGEGEASDAGTLALTWLVADTTDHDRVLALDILSELLLGDAGTLQKALVDSGLGDDLSPVSGLFTEIRDVSFTVGLRGASPDKLSAFEDLVWTHLRHVAVQGFSSELVESVLATYEFSAREVKGGGMGLRFLGRATRGWLHGSTLVESLQFLPRLQALKARILAGEPVFAELVSEALIDNCHRASVVCEPDSQLTKAQEEKVLEQLAQIRMALSPGEIAELQREALRLKEFQEGPEPRSVAQSLPELRLKDIPPNVEVRPVSWNVEDGLVVGRYVAHTNGVDYLDLGFSWSGLGTDEYLLLPLALRCLDGLGLEALGYDLLARDVGALTGGISFRSNADESLADGVLSSRLYVRIRMLDEKLIPALILLERMMTETNWSDLNRLHDLIVEMKNDYQGALVPRGHVFASTRAASELSWGGKIGELTGGLAQLDLLIRLADLKPEELGATAEKLKNLIEYAWTSDGVEIMTTGSEQGLASLVPAAKTLVRRLQSRAKPQVSWSSWKPLSPRTTSQYRLIPSSVGFVAHSVRGSRMTDPWHPADLVLSHRLKTGFLWEKIRMKGGAYGAFSMPNGLEGTFTFATYRDPNLESSLEAFRESLAATRREPLSASELKNTIIGTVGNDLNPRSPAEEGFLALQRRHLGITDSLRQAKRDGLLRVRTRDLLDAAERLEAAFSSGQTYVLTGETIAKAVTQRPGWEQDRG